MLEIRQQITNISISDKEILIIYFYIKVEALCNGRISEKRSIIIFNRKKYLQ